MRRTPILGLALLLVLAACGDEPAGTTSGSGDGTTTSAPSTTSQAAATSTTAAAASTTVGDTTTTSEPSDENLAVFIAAMEELLVDTAYEGGALEEPELFLATGYLFCNWLDSGDDADEVITRYLDELAGSVADASDEQLTLTGALLGAAVAVLCPHNAGEVVQG